MSYRVLVLLAVLAPGGLRAQTSKEYRICSQKPKTQTEMGACAGEEAKRDDAELIIIYGKVLAAAADDPTAGTEIKNMERLWTEYRDAYIEAIYPAKDKQAEYGSIYPMEVALLRARLTRRHVTELRKLSEQYKGK